MPARSRAALPAVVLAVAALACGHAQRYVAKGKPVPYEGFFSTFPSGLRLVVYQAPEADRFSLTVSYGTGSGDDPQGREGLAHLVAHLSYRSAPAWGGGARLGDQLVVAGLRSDVEVAPDATDFVAEGPAGSLRLALALEAARMREPVAGVTEDEVAIQRDLLASEARDRAALDPRAAQLEQVREVAFAAGSYGRPALGTTDSRKALTLADARALAAAAYAPRNAVLVVVGPRPPRETAALVAATFGELVEPAGGARGTPAEAPPAQPLDSGEHPVVQRRFAAIADPALWVAWPIAGARAGDEPQARAAAAALEVALRAKLESALGADAPRRVEGIRSHVASWSGGGILALEIALARPEDAERVADLARSAAFDLRGTDAGPAPGGPSGPSKDELSRFYPSGGPAVEDGVTHLDERDLAELQRQREREAALQRSRRGFDSRRRLEVVRATRDRLLAESYLGMERVDGHRVARFLRATGTPDLLAGWQKMVAGQLRGDVTAFVGAQLRRERSVALLFTPGEPAPAVVAPTTAREPLEALSDGAGPFPGPEDALALAGAPPSEVERRTLPNGLAVVLVRRGAAPVARVSLVVRTAPDGVPGAPAGLADLAFSAAQSEPGERELAEAGASAETSTAPEHVIRTARGAAAQLDLLLEATAAWARDPRLGAFDEGRQRAVARAVRRAGDPSEGAARALEAGLFPGHAYGAAAEPAVLGRLSERDAEGWLASALQPNQATLVVVSGEPSSPELWAAIERHFGPWSPRAAATAAPADPPEPKPRVVLVDGPGPAALVAVGFRAPPAAPADETASEGVRRLVEERLVTRLRDEAGVARGLSVVRMDRTRAAALVTFAAVDRDAVPAALTAMIGAPRALAAAPPPAADAARVRWAMARDSARAFETVDATAETLARAAALALPPDRLAGQPAAIAGLDAAAIQRAASALSLGAPIAVVAGEAAVLRPLLERAGFVVEASAP